MKKLLKKIQEKTVEKGSFGYLVYRKKLNLTKTLVMFGIVLIIFITGIIITGTRNNIGTVAAVVLVLPAAKFAVGYITVANRKCADKELADNISLKADKLGICYDLIFANNKNLIGTTAVVVTDKNIFALTTEEKADAKLFESSLKEFMAKDKLNVDVNLFKDEKTFLKRIANANENFDSTDDNAVSAIEWNVSSLKNMCI